MTLGSNRPCVKCGASDRYKSGDCKPCAQSRDRKRYEANRDKIADYGRKYYDANRDRLLERNRDWRKANPEKALAYWEKWHKVNREKVLEFKRNWGLVNAEKVRQASKKWAEANPEKIKARHQNRRARKKGNGGKLSPNIVQTLLVLQKGKCACCGKSLKQGYHLDHIMPIALGGMNTDDNVQLLTPKCNLSKGAKHPDDYMRSRGKLI